MGHQCLVEAYLRYGMMMSKDWHHVVCSGFGETSPEQGPWFRDRYKRHLSHNSWEAPRSQQWAFWRLYTVEKCWWERFFQGNLPLPQICCFPWARNVIVLKTCSVLLFIFFFFLFYFEGWGERWIWNETLHFGQFDLIEEYFILLIGLVLNQFRIHFHFPQGKCSSSSFSLLWLCFQEDLNAQEAKSNFCAGWVHGNSCTVQRKASNNWKI